MPAGERIYCEYIMTNKTGSVLYTGASGSFTARIEAHKAGPVPGFTSKYHVDRLVYYEVCATWEAARAREAQIKGGSRAKKLALINALNPGWRDLSEEL